MYMVGWPSECFEDVVVFYYNHYVGTWPQVPNVFLFLISFKNKTTRLMYGIPVKVWQLLYLFWPRILRNYVMSVSNTFRQDET